MDYLQRTMEGLSNLVHNASQYPNEQTLDQVLDSIKRMVRDYERETGKDMRLIDYRERR